MIFEMEYQSHHKISFDEMQLIESVCGTTSSLQLKIIKS